MEATKKAAQVRSEIIRSQSLYLKEFEAKEVADSRGQRFFSGTRFKSLAVPFLYRLIRQVPLPIAMLPINLFIFIMRALYWWPKNPIRLSCEYICILAKQKGHTHNPQQIYQQFLSNALESLKNYFDLYRNGIESVIDQVNIAENDALKINKLIGEYGGAVLAVPHNLGSLFSAIKMNREFPLIIVTKNPSTIERTKIAIDFYERMDTTILMVRGGNPFELSRTLFSVLKSGKMVGATVDSLDSSENRIEVQVFGQTMGFSAWAAKIAIRVGVPIIPSYFGSRKNQINAVYADPILTNDLQESIQQYVSFFEENILKDPASWGFLGDKKWRRALRGACDNL